MKALEPRRMVTALLAVALLFAGLPVNAADGAEAFDQAFRFASAIDPDPKDKSMAQAAVVLSRAMSGDLGPAVFLAGRVTGWRQGTVYADLAVMLAKQGKHDEARKLVARAEEVRQRIEGWQNGRILSHVAHAEALLGEVESSGKVGNELAGSDIQYVGKSVANIASGHAMRGDLDEAYRALATLEDDEGDYEVAWWRTYGYLEIGQLAPLTRQQRRDALGRAVDSAATIPGWKRGEALILIADELSEFGETEAARAVLESAEEALSDLTPTAAVHGPVLCDLARSFARAGVPERAEPLLERVRNGIGEAMVIDRPQIYAEIGSTYLVLGSEGRAHEFYHSALRNAEELVNARPRALSVVAITSSMGRVGAGLDESEKKQLDQLFAGLRDPW